MNKPSTQGPVVRHYTRLSDFGDNWVRLERPLPVNVSTDWTPEVGKPMAWLLCSPAKAQP
jgi:hypothetical protein